MSSDFDKSQTEYFGDLAWYDEEYNNDIVSDNNDDDFIINEELPQYEDNDDDLLNCDCNNEQNVNSECECIRDSCEDNNDDCNNNSCDCCQNQEFLDCPCGEEKGEIIVKTVLWCKCMEPLAGIRVNLYNIDGCNPELVASKISDCNGMIYFDDLEDGYYRVVEIYDKCMFDKPKYCPWNEIKIDKCHRRAEIEILNKIKRNSDIKGQASVEVVTTKCGSRVPLSCVEVILYKCSKSGSKVVAKEKTNGCGKCTFNNLPEGDYRLQVKLDMCKFSNVIYDPSDDFAINCKDTCVSTTVNAIPRSDNSKGKAKVKAILGAPNGTPIKDIRINLYKMDDCKPQLIASKYTNCNGIVEFDGLEYGTYKLVEVIPDKFNDPIYIPKSEFTIDRKNKEFKCLIINSIKKPCRPKHCCCR